MMLMNILVEAHKWWSAQQCVSFHQYISYIHNADNCANVRIFVYAVYLTICISIGLFLVSDLAQLEDILADNFIASKQMPPQVYTHIITIYYKHPDNCVLKLSLKSNPLTFLFFTC